MPLIYLQSFTGNSNVSIWLKNSWVKKTPNKKQTNKTVKKCEGNGWNVRFTWKYPRFVIIKKSWIWSSIFELWNHTHTRTHARTNTHTHTHAHAHARTHAPTRTQPRSLSVFCVYMEYAPRVFCVFHAPRWNFFSRKTVDIRKCRYLWSPIYVHGGKTVVDTVGHRGTAW